ncbi:hypothetical protein HY045_02940 [Candidatus Woesebacteria bacterium]|nr:hypothetical protein [Candidatus Woesebacteria bacterium]
MGILAGYGEILPMDVIKIFPHGILNVHTSLLPKWRGASPEQATILAGDSVSGGSIMKLDDKMDHGPILTQYEIDVLPGDTRESLRNKIFEKGATVLSELIDSYVTGKIKLKPQNHNEATYTRLIKKEFGFIPPEAISYALEGKEFPQKFEVPFIKDCSINLNPETIERFVRAMHPWPGVWSYIQLLVNPEQSSGRKRIKILKAHLSSPTEENKSKVSLIIDEIQLEGKNPVSFEEFKRGYPTATFA